MKRIRMYCLLVAICVCALIVPCMGVVTSQCTPSTWLNVFVNEHVEFVADPNNQNEYYYSWGPGDTTPHGITLENPIVTTPTYAADAPANAGDTKVDVIITSKEAQACAAQICYGLHVYKCCPLAQTDYCTSDMPTFNWYDSCGETAPFEPDSSIKFEWYVNDQPDPISTSGSYSPDFINDTGYILPTKNEPVKTQTVTFKVLQDTQNADVAHDPALIELYSCTLTFDLHWDPAGNVGVSKTFP